MIVISCGNSTDGGPRLYSTDGCPCVVLLFRKNRLCCAKITNGTSTVVTAAVYTKCRN